MSKYKNNNHRNKVNAYSNKRYVSQIYEHILWQKSLMFKLLKTDYICVYCLFFNTFMIYNTYYTDGNYISASATICIFLKIYLSIFSELCALDRLEKL